MTGTIIQKLKGIRQLKAIVIKSRETVHFFKRFKKRRSEFYFHSRRKILDKARKPGNENVSREFKSGSPDLMYFKDVISYPLMLGKVREYSGGLYSSESQRLIPEAIHYRGYASQDPPDKDDPRIYLPTMGEVKHIVFFAGILYDNFGHFLLESIGRLWAYELVRELDPFILFYEDMGQADYLEKRNFAYQAFTGFGIPLNRILFLGHVTRISEVIVPRQKYGYELCRKPDDIFMHFLRNFKSKNQIPQGFADARKIYVSRTGLPTGAGRPVGEKLFEDYLLTENYFIFHPELHTLYEQLSVYGAAEKIIFCDGGAIHGCILLPDLKADVAVVARRRDNKWDIKEILDQFKGYNKPVSWIDGIVKQYQFGLESWNAISVVDWLKVSADLKSAKFVEAQIAAFYQEKFDDLVRWEVLNHYEVVRKDPAFSEFILKQDEKEILNIS